jgi:type IV pilus assembly protein PilM
MSVGLFYKLFPPPHYLEMRPTGVDISDRSIKFCDLEMAGHGYRVARFGEMSLPVGVIESGEIKNKAQLIESLRKFREEQKITYVSAALPEEQAYIVKLALPNMPRKALYQSIELQLEEYVPLPVDQVVFDYEIIRPPSKTHSGYEVAVSVFPKAASSNFTSKSYDRSSPGRP